ncbi:hypothetical protein [Citrobacter braakii]|uniref:hypothetical protein n=1 Tax=Citrobacter braakii TaxID=57706 RepID=UPI0028BDE34C|nr:hypothetical protein [Citrobacter braakii]MDT7059434.1 hypothetical protein [Citrobacter braakii]
MKLEMAIGLFIFAVFVLSLIQILIRMHCKKIKQKKIKHYLNLGRDVKKWSARREDNCNRGIL